MPNPNREIDTTSCDPWGAAERGILHRDIVFAHGWRYGHIMKRLSIGHRYKDTNILDIGCGVNLPMAKVLYSNRFIPANYVGVDYNPRDKLDTSMFSSGKFPLHVYGRVDASDGALTIMETVIDGKPVARLYVDADTYYSDNDEGQFDLWPMPDTIISLECLEHMMPAASRKLLLKIYNLLFYGPKGAEAIISTPCYNGQAAANHINELTRDALGALLEDLGFAIKENYGTFASIRDYRDNLLRIRPELTEFYNKCAAYYDTNILACIFAPIVPQWSRNNLWVLGLQNENSGGLACSPANSGGLACLPANSGGLACLPANAYQRKFPPLFDIKGPWTSSPKWEELAG